MAMMSKINVLALDDKNVDRQRNNVIDHNEKSILSYLATQTLAWTIPNSCLLVSPRYNTDTATPWILNGPKAQSLNYCATDSKFTLWTVTSATNQVAKLPNLGRGHCLSSLGFVYLNRC